MLKPEEWMDIRVLHREGHSIKAITRMTGRSGNTIRKVVHEKTQRREPPACRPSKLDPYKDYVKQRYESCALSAVRILEEIRPMGFRGSIIILRRYLRSLRPASERAKKLTVRYETPPGKQAQADWAYCGRFADGTGGLISIYAQANHWRDTTANVRIHGTTGEQPALLWPNEQLTPTASIAPYQLVEYARRKADFESYVRFDRRRYSVPPEYAGKEFLVGRRGEQIIVRSDDCIVAEHRVGAQAGACVADPEHVAATWKLSLGRTASEIVPKWEVRFRSAVEVRPLSMYQETEP